MLVRKIDAAQRQLVTAICLFFDGGDPVSVYTLASNAWEIIDVLCRSAGVASLSTQVNGNLPSGQTLKYYVNEPCRNFFKHAERDANPDCSVELQAANVSAILYLAAEDYIRYRRCSPIEVQVFQAWFISVFPEKVAKDDLAAQSNLQSAKQAFPGITALSPPEQIEMGRRRLEVARNDPELATDPGMQPSP